LGSAPPAISFSSWPSLEPTLVPETPSLLLIWLSLSGQITLLARQHDYHFQFPAYDHFSTVQTNPRHIDVKSLHHCARPIQTRIPIFSKSYLYTTIVYTIFTCTYAINQLPTNFNDQHTSNLSQLSALRYEQLLITPLYGLVIRSAR